MLSTAWSCMHRMSATARAATALHASTSRRCTHQHHRFTRPPSTLHDGSTPSFSQAHHQLCCSCAAASTLADEEAEFGAAADRHALAMSHRCPSMKGTYRSQRRLMLPPVHRTFHLRNGQLTHHAAKRRQRRGQCHLHRPKRRAAQLWRGLTERRRKRQPAMQYQISDKMNLEGTQMNFVPFSQACTRGSSWR